MNNHISTRHKQKNDIEANWLKAINFSPLEGEIIVYNPDETHPTPRIKIGDGITNVNDLPFLNNSETVVIEITGETEEENVFTINKTYEEIEEAYNAGCPLYFLCDDIYLSLLFKDESIYVFQTTIQDRFIMVIINESNYALVEYKEITITIGNEKWDQTDSVDFTPAVNDIISEQIPLSKGEGNNSLQQKLDGNSWDNTGKNKFVTDSTEIDKYADYKIKIGAKGDYAAVLGGKSQAKGKRSLAEGTSTVALGNYSHSEGNATFASGVNSHAEGIQTSALGEHSHAEGSGTIASGHASHAENMQTEASGIGSHAEGGDTHAINEYTHAEGYNTTASGFASHAEGQTTLAANNSAHSEGLNTKVFSNNAHAEGENTQAGLAIYTIENGYKINGFTNWWVDVGTENSRALQGFILEGINDNTYADSLLANKDYSWIIVSSNTGTTWTEDLYTVWFFEHYKLITNQAENTSFVIPEDDNLYLVRATEDLISTDCEGRNAHAEGFATQAFGENSHAEGANTLAGNTSSHAEGNDTLSVGIGSHSEGNNTVASGEAAHAEGNGTKALSDC